MSATIRLTRGAGMSPGVARPLQVLLDGKKVAPIKAGQTVEYRVEPGHHRLRVKQDCCASTELTLTMADASTVALECGCFIQGWKLFLIVLWAWRVFVPGKLFWLKRKSGRTA
jgi:hypothetical protein